MHPKFKDWLIKDSDKWSPEEKQSFLRLAKSEPDKVLQIIDDNFLGWATVFAFQTGVGMMLLSNRSDAQELFDAYRQHFATELASPAT